MRDTTKNILLIILSLWIALDLGFTLGRIVKNTNVSIVKYQKEEVANRTTSSSVANPSKPAETRIKPYCVQEAEKKNGRFDREIYNECNKAISADKVPEWIKIGEQVKPLIDKLPECALSWHTSEAPCKDGNSIHYPK